MADEYNSRQVWHHESIRNITQNRDNLISWIIFNWVTEEENIRSTLLTSYDKQLSAYNVPSIVTLETANGDVANPAVIDVTGGMNVGDNIHVTGQWSAGNRLFPFGVTVPIPLTVTGQTGAQYIVVALNEEVGVLASLFAPDLQKTSNAKVHVFADGTAQAETVTIDSVVYTPEEPVIPSSPDPTGGLE